MTAFIVVASALLLFGGGLLGLAVLAALPAFIGSIDFITSG
jgi:hypothetical protein